LGFAYKLVVSLDEDTGYENFYILDLPIKKVKQTTIAFEDQAELGRLFDADVLVKDKNAAISRRDLGPSPRKCFIVIDQLKNVLALGGILLQKCKIIFLNYM